MDSFTCEPGRMIVLRIDAGEDLLQALEKGARDNDVKSASISAIGGLKRCSYGIYYKGDRKEFVSDAKECFEILNLVGNVTAKEDDIMVHAHLTAADEESGKAFGGHLMEGSVVYPFAEVVIQELGGVVDRSFNDELKLWPMKFK